MNILLTGGTGYIGSHAAVELLNLSHDLTLLDNLSNSKPTVVEKIAEITKKSPEFIKIDLLDEPSLNDFFQNHSFDLVIHFAGKKAVGESVEKPLEYYENNVKGSINLFKAMSRHGIKKLIFSSSATVYGMRDVEKFTEDMETGMNISSPYGRSKFMIEEILKDLAASDPDWQISLLRYFNPIGNHPSGLIGEDPNGIPNNLMPIIMKVAKGEIPELKIYGTDYDTEDGTCLRDYIHVVDLAKGHVAAMNYLSPGVSIYNLGSGVGTSVKEMVEAFEFASGKPLPHSFAPRRPGDIARIIADPAKANRELNWRTTLSVKDAMKDTLTFLKKSPASRENNYIP